MAITLLRKLDQNNLTKSNNIKFKTKKLFIQKIEKLYLTLVEVDDYLKPLTIIGNYEVLVSEETFHKELRKKSAIAKHLITSHSTNPEWNPKGYSKNMEDIVK